MAAGNGHSQGINGVIISSDSHVMEPVDLWKKGVPEKYRAHAPLFSTPQSGRRIPNITPVDGIPTRESRKWKKTVSARKCSIRP